MRASHGPPLSVDKQLRRGAQSKVLFTISSLRWSPRIVLDHFGGQLVAATMRDLFHRYGRLPGSVVAQCVVVPGVGVVRTVCRLYNGRPDARDSVRGDGGGAGAAEGASDDAATENGVVEGGLWTRTDCNVVPTLLDCCEEV